MPLFEGSQWLAPKDPKSSGTWLAFQPATGNFLALYNGAFIPHQKKATYSRSRGQVIPDLLLHDQLSMPESKMFIGLEPFSLLMHQAGNLDLFRWDGHHLFAESKPKDKPFQLSSSTLYLPYFQGLKEKHFLLGIEDKKIKDAQTMAHWHRGSDGDSENGIRINRANGIRSMSLTVLDYSSSPLRYTYEAWD